MRIQFATQGGIAFLPGLSRPVTIDSSEMPEQEAADLARLVEAAHFFSLPAQANAATPGAADYQQYTVTVEDGGRRHTVQLVDPVEDPALRALLDRLKAQARAQRRAQRARAAEQEPDRSG